MKNTFGGARHRFPTARPLACSVMLALTTLPMAPVLARDLHGEEVILDADARIEAWTLTGNARLDVIGGSTQAIIAHDSRVHLQDATVARSDPLHYHTLELHGSSSLSAYDSTLRDGGLRMRNNASAFMRNTDILLDATAPHFERLRTIGIDIGADEVSDHPILTLTNSRIRVVDSAVPDTYNSGIGIRQGAGRVSLSAGTRIDAAHVGVLMRGSLDSTRPLALELDNAHIETGRGAALQVAPSGTYHNSFQINVTNGSTLKPGDGTLLRVGASDGTRSTGKIDVDFNVIGSTLTGDIVLDRETVNGSLSVSLYDNAFLVGRIHHASSLFVGADSRWMLTGDSHVGRLSPAAGGSVMLGDGRVFNTLHVDTFNGLQGLLIFNTALGDDASQTDRLVIAGDASGEATVQVLNAGGQGAQTDQGIELITILGESNARFTLSGRVTGGLYEYFLHQGHDGSWYLRSELEQEPPHECVTDPTLPQCEVTLPVEPGDPTNPTDPTDPEQPEPEQPDPEQPDPEDPTKPTPVLRPETGAYLANQAAMGQLLQHGARERMAAANAVDGFRTWAATRHSESRMDGTGEQTLRTRQSRLQVGADIGAFDGDKGRVGAVLTAGQADATARSTVTGYRADARVEGGAAGLYVHWTDSALYLDASVQHGRFRNRVMGEGVAVERYDSGLWQTTLEAGYRFNAGRIGGMALHLEPQLQLTHSAVRMDTHVESNGTVVERAGDNGLSVRVGVRLEGEADTAAGLFRPFVALQGHHDARDNGIAFDGVTAEGAQPDSRVGLSVGGQVQFGSDLSAWGELGGSHGSDDYRGIGARIGLSYRW